MNATKFRPFVGKEFSDRHRTISGFISTDDVDEEGDVVLPSGLDDSYYKDHPTLNLYHNHEKPIGRCRDYTVKAHGVWAKYELGDDVMGEQALKLIRSNIIGGFSIEWNPRVLVASPPTHAEKQMYGDECRRVFREWRLTAVAAVPCPMNGKAKIDGKSMDRLTRMVADGAISPEIASVFGIETPPPKPKVRVFMDGEAVVAVRSPAA